MIQANELRIGNWIQLRNIRERGKQVFPFKVEVKDLVTLCKNIPYVKRCEPILLTSEILEKAGFETDEICYWTEFSTPTGSVNYLSIGYYAGKVFKFLPTGQIDIQGNEINSVHQLQNLYFALTGEELVIDL